MSVEHHHPNDGGYYSNCARCVLNAAAPELLAACKDGAELLGLICEVICIGNPPPQGVERIAKMRAAIAKATT